MWAVTSDLIIAIVMFSALVLLAIVAPIWGVDSRDGVDSDQYARRAPWLYDRKTDVGRSALATPGTWGAGHRTGTPLFTSHVGAPNGVSAPDTSDFDWWRTLPPLGKGRGGALA